MQVMFGNWKYIFKNFWYIMPFAVLPALFLALSLDYRAISAFMHTLVSGDPRVRFDMMFRALSLIRIDSVLGGIYSGLGVVIVALFATFIFALAEKHMRIGKRTLGGVFTQFGNLIGPVFFVTLFYLLMYEVWAVVLSAVCFSISAVNSATLCYLLVLLAFVVISAVLLFLAATFYLWIPCMQITCFKPYHAFVYSYRLMAGVRGKLMAAFALSFAVFCAVVGASVFLPEYVLLPVAFLLFLFLFPGFCVRMETVYFKTDKLDREDLIRSYREL